MPRGPSLNISNQRRVIGNEKLAFHSSQMTYDADGLKKNE